MNDEYTFPSAQSFTKKSRRRFIKGTGTLVALGSLPAYLSADTDALQSSLGALKQRQGIVLYRENDLHSLSFAETLSQSGMQPIALSNDLVRQWRDGLGELVMKSSQAIIGLGNWSDYFVIRGLAAEQRQHVMLELQHPVEQPGRENWAATLAIDYLQLPETTDKKSLQAHFAKTVGNNKIKIGTRSVFSWLIA
jgi:hypothetical protein